MESGGALRHYSRPTDYSWLERQSIHPLTAPIQDYPHHLYVNCHLAHVGVRRRCLAFHVKSKILWWWCSGVTGFYCIKEKKLNYIIFICQMLNLGHSDPGSCGIYFNKFVLVAVVFCMSESLFLKLKTKPYCKYQP